MPNTTCVRDQVRIALIAFFKVMEEELRHIAGQWPEGKKRYAALTTYVNGNTGEMLYYIDEAHNYEDDVDKPIPVPSTSVKYKEFHELAEVLYKNIPNSESMIPYLLSIYYDGKTVKFAAYSNVFDCDVATEKEYYESAQKIAKELAQLLNKSGEYEAKYFEADDEFKPTSSTFVPGKYENYMVGFKTDLNIL